MSKYESNGLIKSFSKVIIYFLYALLLFGIVGLCVKLLTAPDGIYLRYGDTVITSKMGGITLPHNETVTLSIENSDGWGVYSVTDCKVTIIPYVDDSHNFNFSVDGQTYSFVKEKDLTAAFTDNYDGKGLKVTANGEIYLSYPGKTVSDMLSAVYDGRTVTVDNYFLSDSPYVAIQIVSPDGKQTLTVPILFYPFVRDIKISPTEVVF